MITPERAQAILKEFETHGGIERQYADAAALVGTARTAAMGLLGYRPDNVRESYEKLSTMRADATDALSLLAVEERLKVFRALMPSIADEFEATWELSATVPWLVLRDTRTRCVLSGRWSVRWWPT